MKKLRNNTRVSVSIRLETRSREPWRIRADGNLSNCVWVTISRGEGKVNSMLVNLTGPINPILRIHSPSLDDEEVNSEEIKRRKNGRQSRRRLDRAERDAASRQRLENLLADPKRHCVALVNVHAQPGQKRAVEGWGRGTGVITWCFPSSFDH